MGEVVLAHDPRLGRDVAIKRMRQADPNEEAVERFLREAKIQARLDHPAIVPVHELGHDVEGRPYFTMKRLAGETMATRLAANARSQPLLRAMIDVCLAIDLAHTRGVIHRDLKPANIMLGEYGEVYVLDWGVARIVGEEQEPNAPSQVAAAASATQTGAMLGTPGYMAPEQMRGERSVGTPVDVYALGAIMFEILTREALHPRDSAIESTVTQPTDSPAQRRPDLQIAPELNALCMAALAADAAARPTARELAQQLQDYLDGDRDLERRRTLAVEHLNGARDAITAGRHAEGVVAAGRALALDPESAEVAELVTSLLVTPPATLPRELEVSLAAADAAMRRERARRTVVALFALLLVPPCGLIYGVMSWQNLFAVIAASCGLITLVTITWRTGWSSSPLLFATNIALVIAFSRIGGPFVHTPMLICAVMLALSVRSRTKWEVIAFGVTATLLPFVLEKVGLLDVTVIFQPDGILSIGRVFSTSGADPMFVAGVMIASALIAIFIAVFASTLARQRRDAQQRLHIQSWTLQHMLPSRATRALAGLTPI
jgi:eukaryotic-like serine/threonine-protein kinase